MRAVKERDKTFWRDEAKLLILSREKRILFGLSLIGGIAYVASFIGIAYTAGIAMQWDYKTIGPILAVLTLPLALICEMAFKGGNAGNALLAIKMARTSVECFLDESLHFRSRAGTSFSIWMIGVKNLTRFPAKNLTLKIVRAESVATTDQLQIDSAREIQRMKLVATHRSGVPDQPLAELVTTHSFDFVETGNDIPPNRMRIFHNTADPNAQDKIFRSLGLLPLGWYRITLCLECDNAESKFYSVDLNHTPQTGMTLQWNGECGDPFASLASITRPL